jgi:serine/threonine protein kinase
MPAGIPDYELLRPIGRGSYGEVWLARSVTGAYRAVKIVDRSSFEHDRPYEREFAGIRRFEPVSRNHNSQVDVLHVGRNDAEGYFYYVMELADDEQTGQQIDPERYVPKTLRSELKRRGRLPPAESLQVGLALAQALDHLHRQGLIHRDVKPSNIIFVHGAAKLADIGLVADLGATRSFVGTEGYVPPEGPGTPQADLYSLGKVLYEISTGRDRLEYPELPTELRRLPDRRLLAELNEVIVKACDQDPKRRYRSAAEMQADLELLREGQSLREQRRRTRRLAVARRMLLGTAVGAVLLLGGGYAFLRPKQAPILLEDDFKGSSLNPRKWTWQGTNAFPLPHGTNRLPVAYQGFQSGEVVQTNGAVRLCANATSSNGLASVEVVWLDSNLALEDKGDLEVDLALRHSISRGTVSVRLSTGMAPSHPNDPDAVVLYEATRPSRGVLTNHLRIQLLAHAKLALVYDTESTRPVDLSRVKQWRLRFFVRAETSSGFPPATNVWLTVDWVRIKGVPHGNGVVGVVTDHASGRPIEGAKVTCRQDSKSAHSLTNGSFQLATQPGLLDFKIEQEDYWPLETNAVWIGYNQLSPLLVELQKRPEALRFGDVVQTYPLPDWDVLGMDVRDNRVWALAARADQADVLLSLTLATGELQILNEFGTASRSLSFAPDANLQFSGLAWCGPQLLATVCWAGRIYALNDTNYTQLRLFQTNDADFVSVVADHSPEHPLYYPRDPAWDGRYLWLLEHDEQIGGRFGLWQFDLQANRLLQRVEACDEDITGLAWANGKLWVSARSGWVYEADPDLALSRRLLLTGKEHHFRGDYSHLAFADGFLWGWDTHRQCLCKIKIDDQ